MRAKASPRAALLYAACLVMVAGVLPAQQTSSPLSSRMTVPTSITGAVRDKAGKPVGGASVKLQLPGSAAPLTTVTDEDGTFIFRRIKPGTYSATAESHGERSQATVITVNDGIAKSTMLVLDAADTNEITFADDPGFTVAGVTDWTAVGGHGSDATLRTSEDLARATATLKSGSFSSASINKGVEGKLRAVVSAQPGDYAANLNMGEYYLRSSQFEQAIAPLQAASKISHGRAEAEYDLALACRGVGDVHEAQLHIQSVLAQKDGASYRRLAGELDEQSGDPLAAVQQMERATHLDPTEENYFAWGSELLLHRAVWQAAQIFERGATSYPASARLRTGWGTALFAGARYDQAAQRLCEASDLKPDDAEPYIFLGKADNASPTPLPCVQERLARFLHLEPGNATANYLYAMALFRRDGEASREHTEALLTETVRIDPKFADAYLQLGIFASARQQYPEATALYRKAIAADPELGEAHYRLAVAYDRTGQPESARHERELHEAIVRRQADAVEQERRRVKQFLVVLQHADHPAAQ